MVLALLCTHEFHFPIFLFCLALILYGKDSMGKPLTPEDVEGLLSPIPRDTNETIAAIVQDPVVQDAVHHAVNNGSLNGLVVKKNVFIMPASNPNLILSKREHLLVVPPENLEDVRKNITETKEAEAAESFLLENQAFFRDNASEYTPEEKESRAEESKNERFSEENTNQSMVSNEKRRSETKFLEDTVSHGEALPEDSASKKVAVPIVAVINPSDVEKGIINSPIVAILPNQIKNDELNNQVQFLKDNSDKIQKKAQDYIDQSSLAIDPDYWKASTPSKIIVPSPQEVPSLVTEEMLLTPIIVPQWEMLVPSLQDDQMDYSRGTGDMDVAEDIVFRPLFKYRQETQQRSKYYDKNNRRYSYTPYRGYENYYPRRSYFYRPRYDDY